ncbi:MAG: DivIVA domain-containing protein [Mycobacterium sp.]
MDNPSPRLWIEFDSMGDSGLTAEELRNTTFEKPPWPKRGYAEKSVNDFLALAARRLEGRGHLCADDIRGVRFNKAPLGKRGYDQQQVDAVLAEIVTAIEHLNT